ncbi:D(4) dopamine receptor-like protein [Lates japonicus]|uniref:D(4) dopamine receptor-like protein n=1 Tax=Lates japonicus TaxID=270547 RepID=A0AAD3NBG7_LATJO|nr:D(4) dopamine receptor-like protein [Lates japonicus]
MLSSPAAVFRPIMDNVTLAALQVRLTLKNCYNYLAQSCVPSTWSSSWECPGVFELLTDASKPPTTSSSLRADLLLVSVGAATYGTSLVVVPLKYNRTSSGVRQLALITILWVRLGRGQSSHLRSEIQVPDRHPSVCKLRDDHGGVPGRSALLRALTCRALLYIDVSRLMGVERSQPASGWVEPDHALNDPSDGGAAGWGATVAGGAVPMTTQMDSVSDGDATERREGRSRENGLMKNNAAAKERKKKQQEQQSQRREREA